MLMVRGRWFRELVRYGLACAVASAGVLLFAVAPAPAEEKKSAEGMKPPGDCKDEDYQLLKKAVKAACDTPPEEEGEEEKAAMKCFDTDSCAEIKRKMDRFNLCITARTLLSDRCFRGGDQRHHNHVKQLNQGLDKCNRKHLAKVASGECPIRICPVQPGGK